MRPTTRRSVLAGAAGLLGSPAIIGRAAAANSIRMAFDDINAKGGINGRKVRFIVEDMEYLVPKAVQAMNKLVNRDNIFLSLSSGGTPQMDAVLPMMIEKQVPSVFPLTCARSMYEPLSPYKYGQFSSYYDQMRACVKYFGEVKGKKVIGSMYQDTDFGKGSTEFDRNNGDPKHKPNPCLGPIATPPYYAMAVYPSTLGSSVGLKCDADGRVLDVNGAVDFNATYTLDGDVYADAVAALRGVLEEPAAALSAEPPGLDVLAQ